ncbi:hypothetical protein LCGC14_2149290, partial [marine sediment metagenome]
MVDIAKLGVEIDPAGATRGAAVVNRSLDKMSKRAKTTGTKMAGAFKGLKAQLFSMKGLMVGIFTGFAIREVVGKFTKFAGAVQDLAAITGATGQDLKFLSDAAREMGATTTLSAIESAEAIKLIASAKPDLLEFKEALVEVTKEAVALSEASGVMLPEAAKVLGLALNQFGASADEAGRFVNVLAAGAKFGSSEVAETGQAIEKAGVVARLAGISFEELNAMIQILAANGIKGAIAGTQLRGTILSMAEEGAKGSIKINGLAGAFKNFENIVDDSQAAVKIFGRENITAASILAKTTGALTTLTSKMSDTNTAYEQQRIRVNYLGGDVKALKSTWDELMITIGESKDDEMRSGVQGFRAVLLEVIAVVGSIDLLSAALGQSLPIAATKAMTYMAKVAANFAMVGKITGFGGLDVLKKHGGIAGAFAFGQSEIEEEGKRREAAIRKQFADQLKVRQNLAETRRKVGILDDEKAARERDRFANLGKLPGAGGDAPDSQHGEEPPDREDRRDQDPDPERGQPAEDQSVLGADPEALEFVPALVPGPIAGEHPDDRRNHVAGPEEIHTALAQARATRPRVPGPDQGARTHASGRGGRDP